MAPSDRPGGLSEGTFFSNHPETFRICSRYHLEEIACTNFGDFKKMYSILKILDLVFLRFFEVQNFQNLYGQTDL